MTMRAHVYGDSVDTDRIIAGKYTKTLDMNDLAKHVMEDLDPQFITRFRTGDVVVAGEHFGCGSSREQAALALKAAGVKAVIAKSFARIFYRNAINVGLLVMEIPDHDIQPDDELNAEFSKGIVHNLTQNKTYTSSALPPVMLAIVEAGGLVPFLRNGGSFEQL